MNPLKVLKHLTNFHQETWGDCNQHMQIPHQTVMTGNFGLSLGSL